MSRFRPMLISAALLIFAAPHASAQEPPVEIPEDVIDIEPDATPLDFAIIGATIHPLDRPAERDVAVLVDDGIIVATGNLISPPPETPVIDLQGKSLFPGMIHAFSTLGLVEIGSVRGTRDVNEVGRNNADLRAEVAFNADSLRLPPTRRGGVLMAHIYQRGGLFSGTTAVMRLGGWNWRDMTLDAPTGMVLEFPQVAGDDDEEQESSGKAMKELVDMVHQVRAYAKAKAAASPGLHLNAKLEALVPVFEGERRLFVVATGGRNHLDAALDWIEKEELENVVLVSNYEARYLKERLAELGFPLIITDVLALPSRDWEPYDAAYAAPAVLHEAGVTFAIAGEGNQFASANTRNLPFHAAMAAAFGLPKNIALRSITRTPAEILGIGDRVGVIESGKEATFFVANADVLEIFSTVERAWIAGREVDLDDDHQYRLYQKYWNRPRPVGETPADGEQAADAGR